LRLLPLGLLPGELRKADRSRRNEERRKASSSELRRAMGGKSRDGRLRRPASMRKALVAFTKARTGRRTVSKAYHVNEIFRSLQGEGYRAGTANVFVRFSGCNLQCSKESGPLSPGGFDCDTEFVSGIPMSGKEILKRCETLWPSGQASKAVIFTGGEPGLQLKEDLVSNMRAHGWFTCIETNGTVDLRALGLDWITVSPKVAEHALKQTSANEVKYVRGYGQGIPKTRVKAEHKLISPAFDAEGLRGETLQWCIKLVLENPEWRLSVQQHKRWKIR
jgi:7-carboxy-7-deazaguanine synthase